MLDQALAELAGGVVAHPAEGLDHRRDLGEAGHVAPRTDGQRHVGHLAAEDLVGLDVEAGALLVHPGLPEAEGQDEVDALLATDGADAEDGGDVDDADAAALHVAAVELLGGAHELAVGHEGDAHVVVGHEGVAALDEGEGALALADAGGAAQEDADALDVDERAVDADARGELLLEEDGRLGGEVLGLELGAEEGDGVGLGQADDEVVGLAPAGDDERGDVVAQDGLEALGADLGREVLEVGDLAGAEHLEAAVGELLEVAGQRERRAVEGLLRDDLVEAAVPGHEVEAQEVAVGVVEVADRDLLGRTDLLGFGHGGFRA